MKSTPRLLVVLRQRVRKAPLPAAQKMTAAMAVLAFLAFGTTLTSALAAGSSASLSATILGSDKLEVIGKGFPGSAAITINIKAGANAIPATAMAGADGRFSAIKFLPANYSGAVAVTATGGGASASASANATGTGGTPAAATPAPSTPVVSTGDSATAPAPAPAATPAPAPAPAAVAPAASEQSKCTQTAAKTLNWGAPTYETDFNGTKLDPTWHAYGPESGHGGEGTRTPAAITESGGVVKIASDGKGQTGAMKWFPGQKYGRWEVCMKSETGEQHYVAILWPDAEDFGGGGGEIDFVEEGGGTQKQDFFLHCGTDEPNCKTGSTSQDASQWTSWAVEWTPQAITAYVNGKEWFKTTDASEFPPRSMNLCLQLDPGGGGADAMDIDNTKQWAIPQSVPGTLGLKPGENSTGHPEESPERKPRPLSIAEMTGKAA